MTHDHGLTESAGTCQLSADCTLSIIERTEKSIREALPGYPKVREMGTRIKKGLDKLHLSD